MTEHIPLYLLGIGFAGKAVGWARMAWQLYCTRRAGRPVFPFACAWSGLVAIALLLAYYISIGEPVGIVGYSAGIFSSIWNIYYGAKHKCTRKAA